MSSPDPLELLRLRAHRTSLRLVSVAGVTTGLLLGIGFFFLHVSTRGAVAVWALMIAVSSTIVMVSVNLKRQADDIHAVGRQLRSQVADGHARQVDAANALGEVRNRLATVERELAELRAQATAAEPAVDARHDTTAATAPTTPPVPGDVETLLLRRPDPGDEAIA